MKPIKLILLVAATQIITLAAVFLVWTVLDRDAEVVPIDARTFAEMDGHFTFLIASDLGRNGYYDQRPVAEMMGEVADIADVEFIAVPGDIHHFLGVRSLRDPMWLTNFEWIYRHPGLMIPWHPVLGNHEYLGNTEAVLDYGTVSRRWEMPGRYYAITEEISDETEALMLFIDTPTLIDKYLLDPVEYPDAGQQSMDAQLAWIDTTLGESDATWKVVMGHHPVYAGTDKDTCERTDLQDRLRPLLAQLAHAFALAGRQNNSFHPASNSYCDGGQEPSDVTLIPQ